MDAKEYFNVDHTLHDLYSPEFLAYPLWHPSILPQELYVKFYKLAMYDEPLYARHLFLLMQQQVDERNNTIYAKNRKIVELSRELSQLKRANK